MLENLAVILFRPKFSENVGSTARAMANMGCAELIVVSPQEWDEGRARALATAKGQDILDRMVVVDTLAEALGSFEAVFGTTARTGGWRKGLLSPETAAARGVESLRAGARVAVLFGPEDKGLTNDETKVCGRLVTIPTSDEASSLNLAQAVLILLYEFLKASRRPGAASAPDGPEGPEGEDATPLAAQAGQADQAEQAEPGKGAGAGRAATFKEREALFANLREALTAIDFIKDDNADYWMLPVRAFVERIRLKRAEFNLLMGVCRQIKWVAGKDRRERE